MVREEVAYECQCVCVCVCDSHFKTIESSWRLEMPGFGATKAKLIIQIGFKHTHTYRVKEVTKVRNQTHFLLSVNGLLLTQTLRQLPFLRLISKQY